MEELTLAEIDDWLTAHDMVILASVGYPMPADLQFRFPISIGANIPLNLVWLYHRDTKRANWVSWQFIRNITNADAGIWPMEYFS